MRYQAALHSDLGAASASSETDVGLRLYIHPLGAVQPLKLAAVDCLAEAVAELGELGGDAADLAELLIVNRRAEQR